MQEAGATADIELGGTLADGLEYIRTGVNAGLHVDKFAPRLSFSGAIGKTTSWNWAKCVRPACCTRTHSFALKTAIHGTRTHSQTSGWSLTEQDPFNNVAVHVWKRWPHWAIRNSYIQMRLTKPSRYPDFSARIACNTQLYIQDETKVCKVIDP